MVAIAKLLLLGIAFALLLCAALVTNAASQPSPQPAPVPAEGGTEAQPPVEPAVVHAVGLEKGDVAPMDGVLLSEPKFIEYQSCRNDLTGQKLEVEARDRALKRIEEDLAVEKAKTAAVANDKSWLTRNQVGISAIVLSLAALAWGSSEFIDTVKN